MGALHRIKGILATGRPHKIKNFFEIICKRFNHIWNFFTGTSVISSHTQKLQKISPKISFCLGHRKINNGINLGLQRSDCALATSFPKYLTVAWQNSHLAWLRVRLAFKIWKTLLKFLNDLFMSQSNTQHHLASQLFTLASTLLIKRWNVAGAFLRPNSRTSYCRKASGVANGEISEARSVSGTYQYPLSKSNLVTNLDFPIRSIQSSIFGSG